MLKKSLIATAITGAVLASAGPALAATGHSTTSTGGSPLGATGALAPYTGSLFGQDGAGNVTFVTPIGTITCTTGTAGGTITADGGAAYPIGGVGPDGYLSTLALTNAGGAACTSSIASLGNPTAVTTVLDSNGAAAGLITVKGDWNGGAPRISFLNPTVDVKLTGIATPCRYQQTAGISGAVNNSAGTLTFASQPLTRISPSPSACPVNGQFNGVFNLSRSATLAQPLYLSA